MFPHKQFCLVGVILHKISHQNYGQKLGFCPVTQPGDLQMTSTRRQSMRYWILYNFYSYGFPDLMHIFRVELKEPQIQTPRNSDHAEKRP